MSVGNEVPECSWPKRPQQAGFSEKKMRPMYYHHCLETDCYLRVYWFSDQPKQRRLKLKLFRVLLQRRPAHRSATPSLSIPVQGTALQPQQEICAMGPGPNNNKSNNNNNNNNNKSNNKSNMLDSTWFNMSHPSPKESFLTNCQGVGRIPCHGLSMPSLRSPRTCYLPEYSLVFSRQNGEKSSRVTGSSSNFMRKQLIWLAVSIHLHSFPLITLISG